MIINTRSLTSILLVTGMFLLIIGTNFPVSAQERPLKFSYLSVDNGLSHTDINVVKQDKLGFIWIGTLFGLDRFDGHSIKRFYNTNVPKYNGLKNRIISMCIDENDRIWIGSESGIQYFDPRTEKYVDVEMEQHNLRGKIFSHVFVTGSILAAFTDNQPHLFTIRGNRLTDIHLSYPKSIKFTDLVPGHNGNIWLSSDSGMWLLNRSFHFEHCKVTGASNELNNVFFNREGKLLITASNVIALIKSANGTAGTGNFNIQARLAIPGCNVIRDVVQDRNLNYWISTDIGICCLDRTLHLRKAVKMTNTAGGLNSNNPDQLFIDRSECLWICTWATGIDICDLNAKPFFTLQHTEQPNSLSANYIRSMLGDTGRKVWIGTNGGGLNAFDPQTQKIERYTTNSQVKLKSDQINALALDGNKNLWMGTESGIQILNSKHNGLLVPAGYKRLPAFPISGLAKDCYGNIWFGTYANGFGSIICNKNNVYQVKYYGSGPAPNIWADNKKPELFISTTHGSLRLVVGSAGNIVKSFPYQANDKANSLSSDYVFQVQKQNDSTYWIGTIGGGVDRLLLKKDNTYNIRTYDSRYGIFNDVETIEFDRSGNLWMGGNGLERFNPDSKKLTRFDINDGLQGNSFKIGASYRSPDGWLYFGGINGLNYFFPDSIKINPIAAYPAFTDLLINTKKVIIGNKRSGIDGNFIAKSISYVDTLYLNYLQNNFAISFSAMHYANPGKCRYRYKLIGYDQEWKFTDGNNPTAAYSNLDYSGYTFVVEATNNDGIWSKNKAVIDIIVAPPWWKSTFAKLIYLLLTLSGLVSIYIYQARWFRLKRELSIRQLEEKKQEELYQQQLKLNQQVQEKNKVLQEADEFKNRLVSILAHDFRSPLSSTISVVRLARNKRGFDENELEQFYDEIESDATQMLNSFDVILQWIRQQLSGYQFRPEALNVHHLFDEAAALLSQRQKEKKIVFSNRIPDNITVIADKEMLQFINRNLLSNAIKFSPESGVVIIGCTKSVTEIIVTVSDDGPGFDHATLDKLFSISSQAGRSTKTGAGIALFMCRDFIAKMNGRIWVENKQPTGATFYYAIPSII